MSEREELKKDQIYKNNLFVACKAMYWTVLPSVIWICSTKKNSVPNSENGTQKTTSRIS